MKKEKKFYKIAEPSDTPAEHVAKVFKSHGIVVDGLGALHLPEDNISDLDYKSMKLLAGVLRKRYQYDFIKDLDNKIRQLDPEDVEARATLKYRKLKFNKYSKQDIEDEFDIYITNEVAKSDERFREFMRRGPSEGGMTEVKAFLRAITGKQRSEQLQELDLQVFLHWLWQVKRKACGLPVRYEMLINIHGKQGSGKSTAIRRLCSNILQERYTETSLRAILDVRGHFLLKHSFVNLFEELEGASRVDIDNLKALITAPKLSWRILGEHKQQSAPQNCTFISSSNKSLDEVFYDPSGMRRFYEIKSDDLIDHAAINKIDYHMLWEAVDVTQEQTYIELSSDVIKERLLEEQDSMRARSSVEHWLEDQDIQPGNAQVPVIKLFDHYRNFCERHGYRQTSNSSTFSKALTRRYDFVRKRDASSRYIGIDSISASKYFNAVNGLGVFEDDVN